MLNYFEYTYFLAAIIVAAIGVLGVFCSIGWLLSNNELKRERVTNRCLKLKTDRQRDEIESLRAKNGFLLNRISELGRADKEQGDVQV